MNQNRKNWRKQQDEYFQKQRKLNDAERRKLEKQRQQQRQKEPVLTYDTNLLKRINHNCLNQNENIDIRYSGVSADGLVEYTMYFHVDGEITSTIKLGFGQDYLPLHFRLIIDSYTEEQHRQKHYNTILRCVLVMLMPDMKINGHSIRKVYSDAENSLSVYVLTKLGFDADYFDLSFYNPSIVMTQDQMTRKQKQGELKQFIFKNSIEDIPMILLKQNYQNSAIIARSLLKRLRSNCLKRRIEDEQQQQRKLPQSLERYKKSKQQNKKKQTT